MELLTDITFNVQLTKQTFCRYQLKINNKHVGLSFPQLLQLRNKVLELTTPTKLSAIINTDNFVLLFVADKQHLLFLETATLLDLKEELDFCFNSFY